MHRAFDVGNPKHATLVVPAAAPHYHPHHRSTTTNNSPITYSQTVVVVMRVAVLHYHHHPNNTPINISNPSHTNNPSNNTPSPNHSHPLVRFQCCNKIPLRHSRRNPHLLRLQMDPLGLATRGTTETPSRDHL